MKTGTKNNESTSGTTQQTSVVDKSGKPNKVATYLGLVNEQDSTKTLIEFDLITARQRGEEIRYLSISLKTKDSAGTEDNALISVDEAAFKQIKEFFINIEWNS